MVLEDTIQFQRSHSLKEQLVKAQHSKDGSPKRRLSVDLLSPSPDDIKRIEQKDYDAYISNQSIEASLKKPVKHRKMQSKVDYDCEPPTFLQVKGSLTAVKEEPSSCAQRLKQSASSLSAISQLYGSVVQKRQSEAAETSDSQNLPFQYET